MNNCETACWSSSSTSGVGIVHKKVINSGSAAGYSLLQQGAIKPLQVVLYIHSFMSGCAHRFEQTTKNLFNIYFIPMFIARKRGCLIMMSAKKSIKTKKKKRISTTAAANRFEALFM
ncbi:hypothetical protein T4A_11333 [Trichinella pseudospiralis]|uniref:Uncharacterized protein n=1 Tax=Trichinella pseudospiralis TaxID=6337 RepID=A0A0V1K0P5_TRIPS|nr:hypothetical protein T4A_11333 [Trichinella pseudospiralis]KRZ40783.1 hypothetical protein T4C_10499 [Trichinella pseudospiralis]